MRSTSFRWWPAVAELDGDVVMGVRSSVSIARPTPPPATTPTEGQCEFEH